MGLTVSIHELVTESYRYEKYWYTFKREKIQIKADNRLAETQPNILSKNKKE